MGWAYLSSQVTTLGDSLDQTDIVRMSVGTLSVTKQMQLSSSPVRGQRPGLRDLTGCLAASALGRFLVPSGLPPPAGLPHSSEVTARIQTSQSSRCTATPRAASKHSASLSDETQVTCLPRSRQLCPLPTPVGEAAWPLLQPSWSEPPCTRRRRGDPAGNEAFWEEAGGRGPWRESASTP